MDKVVSAFMQDVTEYLSLISIYGKPNHKYFNFVINRMGLLCIFYRKNDVFKSSSIVKQFIEKVLVGLKKKFISETSVLTRAALIFLLAKIFFTDDVASLLKLKVTHEEWDVFSSYIEEIKDQPDYATIKISFYQLFCENFFKFTMKNKSLALDYGVEEDEKAGKYDSFGDMIFLDGIRKEVEVLERSDIAELLQLNTIREQAIKPFECMFAEKAPLTEALEEFSSFKQALSQPTKYQAPSKISRKEVVQSCREFLNSPRAGGSKKSSKVDIEDIESDGESEHELAPKRPKKTIKRKSKAKPNPVKTTIDSSDSSDSGSERDFKKTIRSLGFNSQNVMKGIGAENFSIKLKECYEGIKKEK